ncbi:MAG: hypothetical protein AVDCRST_MAG55-3198, partial [uncultured Rubrobacteraceae bacterium]
ERFHGEGDRVPPGAAHGTVGHGERLGPAARGPG